MIVQGSQSALDVAARVLVNPGDPVRLEDPGYSGARGAFLGAGANIVPVPVDREGLVVELGVARAPQARLVYLTPFHQFPLGGVSLGVLFLSEQLTWQLMTGAILIVLSLVVANWTPKRQRALERQRAASSD
jgi:GntR family transcriptional regulator / MocR family aminotransferase